MTAIFWDGGTWSGDGGVIPPPPLATGATVGAPGAWTPTGSTPPANLAACASVVATPTTAWATGSYMVLGDASHAYWNGTAWTAGNAP